MNKLVALAWFMMFQMGIGGAIIGITKVDLVKNINNTDACFLSSDPLSPMYCNLAYITGGVGIGLSIFAMIFSIMAGHHKLEHFSRFMMGVIWTVFAAAFSVAGSAITIEAVKAEDNSLPYSEWRTAVYALIWSSLGLTFIMSGISQLKAKKIYNQNRPITSSV
jgi:hypothetical protein